MKMKRLTAIILMLALVLTFTACGKDYSDSPYVGSWTGTEAEYSGMTLSVAELFNGFDLTLNPNGKATVTTDGETRSGKWEPTDNGVMLDGEMELIASGDYLTYETDGVTIKFEKQ
ncbi:MAG: hypothetical protein Q4B22_07750 [Eubacteriales bacterium]|nr:hypothetical protein [Eubacteriales bacterium]